MALKTGVPSTAMSPRSEVPTTTHVNRNTVQYASQTSVVAADAAAATADAAVRSGGMLSFKLPKPYHVLRKRGRAWPREALL